MYGPPGELMNVGTPGPTLGELAPGAVLVLDPGAAQHLDVRAQTR